MVQLPKYKMKSHQTNSASAGKPSSKKDWKLSDSLREKIAEYAREVLMGKLNQNMADMKEIREADRRWLCMLFGEPYEAKFPNIVSPIIFSLILS